MKLKRIYWRWLTGGALAGAIGLVLGWGVFPGALAQEGASAQLAAIKAFDEPTYSSPIAMDALKNLIWVVNPEDASVSVIGDLEGNPSVLRKFNVGDEPQSVALDTDATPESYHVYVANAADNSITIINVTASSASSVSAVVEKTLTTGAEPWNIVASPDGQRVFVANSAQDTITVIRTDDPAGPAIIGNVVLKGTACLDNDHHFQPRGLAVTTNNDRLYVTRFLSYTGGSNARQGTDDGKVGLVCRLDIDTSSVGINDYSVAEAITLGAQTTGFNATIGGLGIATQAYPNQLQSIVIRGNQAFLPNIAASPAGPLKFNVDTQAFVNVIDNADTGAPTDAGATKFLNLHLGARLPEAGKEKLFFSNPWAIAFTTQSGAGTAYVASAGSDLLVKLNVDDTGNLDFTVGVSTTRYIDLNDPADPATSGANAGKNPLGIVIRNIAPGNNKAFVMNYISRNVSVVDLDTDEVADVVQLTALPPAGSQAEQLHVGAEMFFSARGRFDDPGGATVSLKNRLSSEGWQNCASCHPAGLTDSVIWRFGAGPRKSVPLNSTWSPHNPDDQRILNYSAIFDEVEDFELNVRNVSGPGALAAPIAGSVFDPNHGLIISDTGAINFAPAVVNAFAKPNAGRPQVTVTLPGSSTAWPALEALREWVRRAIRTPNGPLTTAELTGAGGLDPLDVANGRRLFFRAGCQKCHGGSKWTISHKDFISPPAGTEFFTETGAPNLASGAQFLDRFLSDIGSFNLGVAGQGNPIDSDIGATEKADTTNVADTDPAARDALGKDHNSDGQGDGYNVPSLLGSWALQPYYHNGACETLACVLSNQAHRSAGLLGQDILDTQPERDDVIEFLKSLDAETDFPLNLLLNRHDIFVDPPTVLKGTTATVGVNVSLFGTEADLANLAADLGLTELTVNFELPATGGGSTVAPVSFPVDAFNQDFGQAVVTTTWSVPTDSRLVTLVVTVDPAGDLPEDNENDNSASRRVRLFDPPPDTTPPQVSNAIISPNQVFDPEPQITTSENVKVQFVATDNETVKSFCIVRYTYSVALRRWVEQTCVFQPLPLPGAADTFVVDTRLTSIDGVGYIFVWVKDAAGNISRTPAFDFINFLGPAPVVLNRNDVTLIRLRGISQPISFTFTLDFGDIDVSVFEGFTTTATRCAVSANNGLVAESVIVPDPGICDGANFQLEVRAIVNSRFTIDFAEGLVSTQVGPGQATPAEPTADDEPLVGGPPARQTAIGDEEEVYLPVVVK